MLGLVLVMALLAACGYRQDVPALPGGATSLSLSAVTNRTDVGELDVRLHAELTRRLARQAHVNLLPADGSLQLSISLEQATLTRALDPGQTAERAFSYVLSGRMPLLAPRSGVRHVDGEAISAAVTRYRGTGVLETPAVRDEGWGLALTAFAEEVERRLLRTF